MNQKIRICYIIDNLSFRGGERTFAQLALGLDRRRYGVHVVCSPGGHFVDLLTAAHIPVYPVNLRHKWNLAAVLPIARYLKQQRIDLVHTQGRGDPFGRLAARLAGVPVIISTVAMITSRYWHAPLGRKLLYRAIDRLTNPLVKQWIVVNHESVTALVTEHHIPSQQIAVILNGIEVETYAPTAAARQTWRAAHGLGPAQLAVGAIGKLTWQKGFEHLLRAWPTVQRQVPQARLFIIGEGELESELKTLAAQLDIEPGCTFTGFEADISAALAGLDVVAMPSLVEGLPMVLLEAMAAGKPVVASKIAGSLEAVTDGHDGLLVEPAQPEPLAAALIRVLQTPHLAARLGQAAQQTARQRFTVERVVQENEALYRRLLSRHTKTRQPTPTVQPENG
ncbi:MAG: putative glycosyltransferase EpsD [Anaerolineae bacterium]|nr:putative glycosyltransferase EpsD [Anaerolineae bacterium]